MYKLLFLLAFFIPSLAEAKCQATNAREPLTHGTSVNFYFFVFKNTDCISYFPRVRVENATILSHPKNGKAGVNSDKVVNMLYVPKNDYIGEDILSVRILYKNQKGESGSSIVNIHYILRLINDPQI